MVTVSVLLPVYNSARYLKAAIESLLNQTFVNFELIVIDDGSSDASGAIIQAFVDKDHRIRLLKQLHGGIVKALNYGLREARGRYIARMDADDIALPMRLERQVQFLDQIPGCVVVGSWVRFIDEASLPIYTYAMASSPIEIEEALWEGNGGALVHPATMFQASALAKVKGYRENYRSLEDLDLYLRLLDVGTLANIPEVLLLYRQHLNSVNFTSAALPRRKLKADLMAEHAARCHKTWPAEEKVEIHEQSHRQVYQQWAHWALTEHYQLTALKYTFKALCEAPLQRQSWAFLKYVIYKIMQKDWIKDRF